MCDIYPFFSLSFIVVDIEKHYLDIPASVFDPYNSSLAILQVLFQKIKVDFRGGQDVITLNRWLSIYIGSH